MARHTPLRSALDERGLKHFWVAKRVGIHYSRFSRLVCGHEQPTERERKTIARVLRTPVDELFPPEVLA